MRSLLWIAVLAALAAWPLAIHAEDMSGRVKKAVEKGTLDQPGTKPFHLKAVLAPSYERDKDSGRTGEVEIWWVSPTKWRREVGSPEFHQIEIVDGNHDWQKNEGDYFPEWLREIAVELVTPVPSLDDVLAHVKAGEVRRFENPVNRSLSQINIGWVTDTGTAEVRNVKRSGLCLRENTGELLYAFGFGWGGDFKDYQGFHGRLVARTLSWGTPAVTARVSTLEDLGDLPPGFMDASQKGGDLQPLQTVLTDETSLRKSLLPAEPMAWPPLQDGSLEGNVTTDILVDREGRVRELSSIVSENSAINDAGRQRILAMRFRPFLKDGTPVQAMSQITIPFKTVRPAGSEMFESARSYFERGRRVGFPAAGSGKPYILRSEFDAKSHQGTVEKGKYEDTWLNEAQWRREATFGKSRVVRSRNGEKLFQLSEGPEASLLQLVLRITEPIPAVDTFVESDWRIRRDTINTVQAVRVLAGYESPDGKLDPDQARGFWFDASGLLLKTYFDGIETRRLAFEDFGGVKIAHRIEVFKDGHLAMLIRIGEVIAPPNDISANTFELKGYAWHRAFTSEVR